MVDGQQKTVIEIKCLGEEGPGWAAIRQAHQADQSMVKWGGAVIAAETRDYDGERKPVIVTDWDPDFAGESPIRLTEFAGGINNMTPKLTLGEGEGVLDQEAFKQLQATAPKLWSYLPLQIGCGLWNLFYGYGGSGATVDQIWFDKATHLALREQGFRGTTAAFTAEYNDWEQLPSGRQVPRRVAVTLLGVDEIAPWVFDMSFKTHKGVWLLDKLSQYQGGRKLVVTAEVTEVEAEAAPAAGAAP